MSDRIKIDSNIKKGRPTVGKKDRNIQSVLTLISYGRTDEQIIAVYDDLEKADIDACRQYEKELNYVPSFNEEFDIAKKGMRPFYDLEWFAVDAVGHIARFLSAGFAAIPKLVFRDFLDYENLKNYFENLPKIGSFHLQTTKNFSNELFLEDCNKMAQKGLFTYDWQTGKSSYQKLPYTLLVKPSNPLNIETIDIEIKNRLQDIAFMDLRYQENQKILVEDYFKEINV